MSLRRSMSDLASMTRAAMRKERLLEIEKQQLQEDAEALKMTEEQRQILLRSFSSVKTEFSDLDGLTWSSSALRCRTEAVDATTAPSKVLPPRPPSPFESSAQSTHAFAILTNADLASFSPDDTIRASRSRGPPDFPTSTSCPSIPSGSSTTRRPRSPIKGAFTATSYDEHGVHVSVSITFSRPPKDLVDHVGARPAALLAGQQAGKPGHSHPGPSGGKKGASVDHKRGRARKPQGPRPTDSTITGTIPSIMVSPPEADPLSTSLPVSTSPPHARRKIDADANIPRLRPSTKPYPEPTDSQLVNPLLRLPPSPSSAATTLPEVAVASTPASEHLNHATRPESTATSPEPNQPIPPPPPSQTPPIVNPPNEDKDVDMDGDLAGGHEHRALAGPRASNDLAATVANANPITSQPEATTPRTPPPSSRAASLTPDRTTTANIDHPAQENIPQAPDPAHKPPSAHPPPDPVPNPTRRCYPRPSADDITMHADSDSECEDSDGEEYDSDSTIRCPVP